MLDSLLDFNQDMFDLRFSQVPKWVHLEQQYLSIQEEIGLLNNVRLKE